MYRSFAGSNFHHHLSPLLSMHKESNLLKSLLLPVVLLAHSMTKIQQSCYAALTLSLPLTCVHSPVLSISEIWTQRGRPVTAAPSSCTGWSRFSLSTLSISLFKFLSLSLSHFVYLFLSLYLSLIVLLCPSLSRGVSLCLSLSLSFIPIGTCKEQYVPSIVCTNASVIFMYLL